VPPDEGRTHPGAARVAPIWGAATDSSGRALVAFVVLAYGLSWAWVIPMVVGHQVVKGGQGWPTHYPALFGPAVAAILVVAATSARAGIGDLLRRVVLWRVGWRWWLVALSPAGFLGIALLASGATGSELPRVADFGLFSGVPPAGLLGVSGLIVIGALGEEIGWRGFALPALQRRFSPLVASLILAGIWALWHVPQFFVIATYRSFGVAQSVGFVFALTCGAIVLTCLYNRSGGSILLVAVWHGLFNLVSGTAAATGMTAAVVSTLVMVQAVLLVGLDIRARHQGRPSPLGPLRRPGALPELSHAPAKRPGRRPLGG
jgi:membrane protease YdiL (CAAX protease family)